jgi:nucleotide-binding universal stress UspA family protein
MIKKILVPLDGSPFAEAALKYLETFCRGIISSQIPDVTLLRIVRVPMIPVMIHGSYSLTQPQKEREVLTKWASEYLEEEARALRINGVPVTCRVVNGEEGVSSAEDIIKVEEEIGADLVVMSTHGRRGITRWALGSVAEKVLRGGRTPVLMVRVNNQHR